jgi:hypothetical protein
VTTPAALRELAMGKLSRILGEDNAARVYDEALRAAGLSVLATADDLHAFAQVLVARGGMEAAIGGLLSVAAVLRGARAGG